MPRCNFGEFLGFFPHGLKPFKISAKFKIYFDFDADPKRKVVPFEFICHLVKFGKF
jgi:hypothetical protein